MENHPNSTASPNLPTTAIGDPFLEALAASLPSMGPGGFPTVVAVSGGADSVAMLVGLVRLGVPGLVVAHGEHDLRAEASNDREFVGRLASRLGLPFTWRRLAVRDPGEGAAGEGLEARARRLRYAFLADVAREAGSRHVLVAHTADDQAETILHRILRGTGITGLAGMRRARELCDGVALLRPLLEIPRDLGRAFLLALGEEWQEDATNTDTTRARNFLRHEILSRCANGPYPAAVASLARLGAQAASVADALASAADRLLDLYGARQADGTIVLKATPLSGLDPLLLAEVFATLWRREAWPQRDMTRSHYGSLAELLCGSRRHDDQPATPDAREYPGGIMVMPTKEGFLVLRPPNGQQRCQ